MNVLKSETSKPTPNPPPPKKKKNVSIQLVLCKTSLLKPQNPESI